MPSQNFSRRPRNNSGELDVFEATSYFSGFTDIIVVADNPSVRGGTLMKPSGDVPSELDKEERQHKPTGSTRSLDVTMTRANVTPNGAIGRTDRNYAIKEKSPRTPSSPGGKIVNFLNSLFNQSASPEGAKKKTVKKTTATRSLKDQDQDQIRPQGWQRRRTNSIGHIVTSSAWAESKSPPIRNRAPTSFSDSRMPPPCTIIDETRNDTRGLTYPRQAAISVSIGNRAREEFAKWKVSCVEKEIRNLRAVVDPCDDDDNDDVGNESDMSSDLFELPVYDSTRIDSIRRSSISTDSSGSSFLKLHA